MHYIKFIFLLSTSFISSITTYAKQTNDTVPPCIKKMLEANIQLTLSMYQYKGQRWYGISENKSYAAQKKANYVRTIYLYNNHCLLMATWQTGGNGIIIINKIVPDTVDTKAIKKIIKTT
ncbi:hypothetical protein ACFOWM_11630 [Ferruginibacter yonginensis]|uniref:DUF4359 domain-containing protein n=1 Tax=Ferruginibacter yonginensis TaxID=1310416 RepID=A0ABV8QTJ1_9BACT